MILSSPPLSADVLGDCIGTIGGILIQIHTSTEGEVSNNNIACWQQNQYYYYFCGYNNERVDVLHTCDNDHSCHYEYFFEQCLQQSASCLTWCTHAQCHWFLYRALAFSLQNKWSTHTAAKHIKIMDSVYSSSFNLMAMSALPANNPPANVSKQWCPLVKKWQPVHHHWWHHKKVSQKCNVTRCCRSRWLYASHVPFHQKTHDQHEQGLMVVLNHCLNADDNSVWLKRHVHRCKWLAGGWKLLCFKNNKRDT